MAMNPGNAIEVRDVEKTFTVHLERSHQLKDAVIFRNRSKVQRREVLRGVSFDVRRGEAVALIGKNGCGKSTTLKLLTKILRPDKGTIQMRGRVSSLIELGAGFHPDMTGRENVFINASIFGIKRKEVEKRMNDIIRFSELEEFIDNPVRTYSSGMYMRLAFAVAINVDADILLVDEILAVGDAAFQAKCFAHLQRLKARGVTIVIVSHSMGQVEAICDRAIWIQDGLIREEGETRRICSHYLDDMDERRLARAKLEREQREQQPEKTPAEQERERLCMPENFRAVCEHSSADTKRSGQLGLQFVHVVMQNGTGQTDLKFETGGSALLRVVYKARPDLLEKKAEDGEASFCNAKIELTVANENELVCYRTTKQIPWPEDGAECAAECAMPKLPLLAGRYVLSLALYDMAGAVQDRFKNLLSFEVSTPWRAESGLIDIPHSWQVSEGSARTGAHRPYDFLVVGAGLYGAVFARQAADAGKKCLVIDKREHIAGNVYTEKVEGIDVHRYGAHIFHTNDKSIWKYVNRFAEFNRYTNSPVANYKGELYSLPFNMYTFYKMWGVATPEEAAAKIAGQREAAGITEPKNLEEQAISLVGTDIYEKLIKGYTQKQWGRPCNELPAFIIRRLPVRLTFDNNYFNALYQGIPIDGYTSLVRELLGGTEVRLGVDYLKEQESLDALADTVVYTGPIDAYFGCKLGALQYRSVRFETETLDRANYQGNAVVNYTDAETPYTRIIEHKHFTFGTQPKTVISREYSAEWKPGDEPYYPVNDKTNTALYEKYRALADAEQNVIFGGRLGEYKYYDMDQVIAKALQTAAAVLG